MTHWRGRKWPFLVRRLALCNLRLPSFHSFHFHPQDTAQAMGGGSPFPSQEVAKDEPLPEPAERPAARNSVQTLCELWSVWSDCRFLFLLLLVYKVVALRHIAAYCGGMFIFFGRQEGTLVQPFFVAEFWTTVHLCVCVAGFPSLLHIAADIGTMNLHMQPCGMHNWWTPSMWWRDSQFG